MDLATVSEQVPFEELQRHLAQLLTDASSIEARLTEAQYRVQRISIYRPLKAFRSLRGLSTERDGVRADARRVMDALGKVVMITPDRTTGQTLSSCLDTIRISAEISRVQAQSVELESSVQQTGAFAFAVFALYVSLVSLFATVLLGLLSLVK